MMTVRFTNACREINLTSYKRNYIEENLEDFLGSLTPSQKRALNRWLDTDEDDKKIKNIKEKIKLLLYNSRYLPIKSNDNNDDGRINYNDNIKILVRGEKRGNKSIL